MEAFLYFLIALFVLDIIGKCYLFYKRDMIRSEAQLAIDLVLSVGVLCWSVWLLARM